MPRLPAFLRDGTHITGLGTLPYTKKVQMHTNWTHTQKEVHKVEHQRHFT